MEKLDKEKLLEDLQREHDMLMAEADESAKLGWYTKAHSRSKVAEGVKAAIQMINLGDYTIEE